MGDAGYVNRVSASPQLGVIPAKAGNSVCDCAAGQENRGSRFRGNDPVGPNLVRMGLHRDDIECVAVVVEALRYSHLRIVDANSLLALRPLLLTGIAHVPEALHRR